MPRGDGLAVLERLAPESLKVVMVTTRLLQHLRHPAGEDTGWRQLTEREREVADLVADGLTNADIAATLVISAGTVKNHLAAIQRKLEARNRVGIAAAAWARRPRR